MVFLTFEFSFFSLKLVSHENNFSSPEHFDLVCSFFGFNSLPDFHVVFYLDGVFWIILVIVKAPTRVKFLLGFHTDRLLRVVF